MYINTYLHRHMDVLVLHGNYEQGRMAVAAGSRLRPHVLAKIDCVYQGVVDREAHPRNLTQPRLLTRLHTCIHTYILTHTHRIELWYVRRVRVEEGLAHCHGCSI